jgi:hypothetical protein
MTCCGTYRTLPNSLIDHKYTYIACIPICQNIRSFSICVGLSAPVSSIKYSINVPPKAGNRGTSSIRQFLAIVNRRHNLSGCRCETKMCSKIIIRKRRREFPVSAAHYGTLCALRGHFHRVVSHGNNSCITIIVQRLQTKCPGLVSTISRLS